MYSNTSTLHFALVLFNFIRTVGVDVIRRSTEYQHYHCLRRLKLKFNFNRFLNVEAVSSFAVLLRDVLNIKNKNKEIVNYKNCAKRFYLLRIGAAAI